jgi:hypothetical protein
VGQLASGLSSAQPGRGDLAGRVEAPCPRASDDRCAGENPAATCQSYVVSCNFFCFITMYYCFSEFQSPGTYFEFLLFSGVILKLDGVTVTLILYF